MFRNDVPPKRAEYAPVIESQAMLPKEDPPDKLNASKTGVYPRSELLMAKRAP